MTVVKTVTNRMFNEEGILRLKKNQEFGSRRKTEWGFPEARSTIYQEHNIWEVVQSLYVDENDFKPF